MKNLRFLLNTCSLRSVQSLYTILLLGTLIASSSNALVISRDQNQVLFNNPINDVELDPFTGVFYVASGDGDFSIASAGPNDTTFTALTGNTSLSGANVIDIALMATGCQEATNIAAIDAGNDTIVSILDLDDSTVTQTDTLFDAAGVTDAHATVLTTNNSCIFARVTSDTPDFVSTEPLNSGIATISVDGTIEQGSSTTPAVRLDYTSPEAQGDGSDRLRALIVNDLHWDFALDRLYAGMLIIVNINPYADNVGFGLVTGSTDSSCNLTLARITDSLPAAGTSSDIFAVRPVLLTDDDAVNIHHVSSMHTSTELDYLIVNGASFRSLAYLVNNTNQPPQTILAVNNQTVTDDTGNLFYALPLGSKTDFNGLPSTTVNPLQGQVVQNVVSSTIQTLCCTNPCTECLVSTGASLSTALDPDFDGLAENCALVIGQGPAPWDATPPVADAIFAGDSIAYFLRTADCTIVSNVEDPGTGTPAAPNAGYQLVVNLVQDETPVQTTQPATTMLVEGDTVYVSVGDQIVQTPLILSASSLLCAPVTRIITVPVQITVDRSATNDFGVFASQAMFDCTGKVIGWTAWERVYPTTGDAGDKTPFFAVDAATGKMWKVSNDREEVRRTEWVTINPPNSSLMGALDKTLGAPSGISCKTTNCGTRGVFSVLDLLAATTSVDGAAGFDGTTSYALFGGFQKVAFARTKQTDNVPTPPLAFNDPANFKVTALPNCSDAVYVLGYTNRGSEFEASERNLFFAGTSRGLYAYAHADGTAFDTSANEFAALDAAPFATNDTWHLVPGTQCLAVTAIDSDCGANMYFVAQDTSQNGCCTLTDRLFKIDLGPIASGTVSNLSPITIAQSGVGGLPANTLFTGFEIITDDCSVEPRNAYGVISTNNGIFVSTVPINTLTNSGFFWQQINRSDCLAFNFLTGASKTCSIRNKLFAIYARDGGAPSCGSNCQGIYQHSSFMQLGNCATDVIADPDFSEMPPNERRFFINDSKAITLVDYSTYFWSDGARRFFAAFNPGQCAFSTLQSLPYDACRWNLTGPFSDTALGNICRIYWIENISGAGLLLAGTDFGVIALADVG